MHVAIIMDGNGRWAERRGLSRSAGHRAGARAVRDVVEAAAGTDVDTLTLYAFSTDNWRRPADEIAILMRLLRRYLVGEAARCSENGIRLRVIGRRDRLAPDLVATIEQTERITAGGTRLLLQIAVDYSARDSIERAAGRPDGGSEPFAARLAAATGAEAGAVDLLIRTGGERRLSDFLLFECAYAELVFVDVGWPDFGTDEFSSALCEFGGRRRRFGGLDVPESRTGGRP